MRKGLSGLLMASVLFLGACSTTTYLELSDTYVVEESATDAYAKIENSVVYIRSSDDTSYEVGSGVVVKEDNEFVYILTNKHVVGVMTSFYEDYFENVEVRFKNGVSAGASIVGSYNKLDVAVLKVSKEEVAGAYTVADISVSYNVSDSVLVYGNPMEIPFVVSKGIVSATDSVADFESDGLGLYYGIQTDAAINPGNSGGGVFDINGNLIGIAQGGLSNRNGIGYAIPIKYAMAVANKLIETGTYTISEYNFEYVDLSTLDYGSLGIASTITEGVYVTSGTNQGKIVKSVNGVAIKNSKDMYMNRYLMGDTYTITYINADGTEVA